MSTHTIARPGHVRIVAKRTGRGAENLPAEERTACGAERTGRDFYPSEIDRLQKAGWEICPDCLKTLAAFLPRETRRRR
jgi:hypothetical protein